MSYYDKVIHYEGSYLVFKRTKYGSDAQNIKDVLKTAE